MLKMFFAALIAAALLSPSQVDAYGVYHRGYTHVGPYGVQHYGTTAYRGPYSAGYATRGTAYGGGYHYGYADTYHAGYGAAATGYHYAGGYGGYHYGYVR